jgi:glycosyltransferase involved in cell wall biosynthesis
MKSMLPKLKREEMTPPLIQSVALGIKRPRWSVMIPTYNCARFLRETLQSVLSQDIDPAEMQIEVVDDCSSSDDPEAIVREFGQGRVSFFRKAANAGATENFNTCIARSIGTYLHILHGDDFIKPGFYRAVEQSIDQYGDSVDLYIIRCIVVNEIGEIDSMSPRIKDFEAPTSDPSSLFLTNSVRTPGCIIKRSFYEQNGGFLNALVHTADWELWARATSLGKALFINELLAVYRSFDGNDTGKLARTGEIIRDYYRLSQVMADRYPSYPYLEYLQSIVQNAAQLSWKFRGLEDHVAANANLHLSQEIIKELPAKHDSFIARIWRKCRALVSFDLH